MPPLVILAIAVAGAVGTVAAFKSGAPLWSVLLFGPFATAFAPKPSGISLGFQGDLGGSPRYGTFGPIQNTVSNELAVPVIYGQLLYPGNLIWQSEPGTTVYRIIGVSEGQISTFNSVMANNTAINTLPDCSYTAYVGTLTQQADSRLPANLRPDLEFHNLAYLALTLTASDQLKGGDPTITSLVQGLLVQTWVNGAWTTAKSYSNNPAACIRDFIINTRYGIGIPSANVDSASFGAAYDYCNEIIKSYPAMTSDGQTVLLLNMNDSVGSSVFIDSSSLGLTITSNGSPYLDSSQVFNGLASGKFNGSTDYLSVPNSSSFDFASGDFTIETSFYPLLSGSVMVLWSQYEGGTGNRNVSISIQANGTMRFYMENGSSLVELISTTPVNSGTWQNVRVFRSGNTWGLCMNGSLEATATYSGAFQWVSGQTVTIAATQSGSGIIHYYCGWLAQFRVSKGVARSSGSFSPNLQDERRFQLDYVADSQRPAQDVLNDMLSTFSGFLLYSGSTIKLKIEKPETITQYFGDGSTTKTNASFDPGNILKDSFTWNMSSVDDRPNRLKIQWLDPTQNYVKVYTQVEDRIDQDSRNTVITKEVSLLGITRQTQASRMAKFMMSQIKYANISITFSASLESIHCEVGDVICVTHQAARFTRKQFRIMDMQEGENEAIQFSCREYNPFIYNDGQASSILTYSQPSGPNLYAPLSDITGLTLMEDNFTNKDGVFVTNILASWTAISADQLLRLDRYMLQLSSDGGTTYRDVAFAASNQTSYRIVLGNVQTGTTFIVRVKTISDKGAVSSGAIGTLTIQGKSTPPSDVQDFDVQFSFDHLAFTWSAIDDSDLFGYEIRMGGASATWETASIVTTELLGTKFDLFNFTRGAKTFFIKAIDNSANYSENAAADSITITDIPQSNVVVTFDVWSLIQELISPLEGTLSSGLDKVITNDYDPTYNRITLQPKTANKWSDYQSNYATWNDFQNSGFFWGRETYITTQESYTTSIIDLGAVYNASYVIDFQTFSSSNLGFVSIQIATSLDGITFSSFTTFVNGNYNTRYLKLKFLIQATDANTQVRLTSAIVTIDVPDKYERFLNLAIDASGSTVTLTKNFTAVKSIVLTTVGTSALTPRVDDQSNLPTSFLVKMFDTSGALQAGNINAYISGY